MSSEEEPPHISMKKALKLSGWKPSKNQTRKDLLVYGGWLTSRWEWSRDIDVSLDQAIANSRRLGEDVRIVGNPSPADRKKVRGRKQPAFIQEPPQIQIKVPETPPLPPMELAPPRAVQAVKDDSESQVPERPPPPEMELAPPRAVQAVKDDSESQEARQPLEALIGGSYEVPAPILSQPAPEGPLQAKLMPDQIQASSLLLQRFLIAAALCSLALFLGYYRLAGTLFVSILLLADAFFIVTTSVLALRHRRAFGGKRSNAPVSNSTSASDAQQGSPQTVG
jgi:hypothetical protein